MSIYEKANIHNIEYFELSARLENIFVGTYKSQCFIPKQKSACILHQSKCVSKKYVVIYPENKQKTDDCHIEPNVHPKSTLWNFKNTWSYPKVNTSIY